MSKRKPEPVADLPDRSPIKGTWAGLTTWRCPVDDMTVVEEPGVDAYARVVAYTASMYPLPPVEEPPAELPDDLSESEPPAPDALQESE